MARPRHAHPTPAELEVLEVLWEEGPSTVREVLTVLNRKRKRAYTSVMSLLNVMSEKGLLRRKPRGRAFVYSARAAKEKTLAALARDLVTRAFSGSASALVQSILDHSSISDEELNKIRETIDLYLEEKEE